MYKIMDITSCACMAFSQIEFTCFTGPDLVQVSYT